MWRVDLVYSCSCRPTSATRSVCLSWSHPHGGSSLRMHSSDSLMFSHCGCLMSLSVRRDQRLDLGWSCQFIIFVSWRFTLHSACFQFSLLVVKLRIQLLGCISASRVPSLRQLGMLLVLLWLAPRFWLGWSGRCLVVRLAGQLRGTSLSREARQSASLLLYLGCHPEPLVSLQSVLFWVNYDH